MLLTDALIQVAFGSGELLEGFPFGFDVSVRPLQIDNSAADFL